MALPITPGQIEEQLVRDEDSIGEALVKLVKLAVLLLRYFTWKYEPNGEFSIAFKRMVCRLCSSSPIQ